jgi:uncharacterized protein (DUF58 family)
VSAATGGTRLGEAVRFVMQTTRRRSLVFWMSDFQDDLDVRDWQVLAKRHDVTAFYIHDPRDEELPAVGWVEFEDLESGARALVNTRSRKVREAYTKDARARRGRASGTLARARCPVVEVRTDGSYLPVLMRYFSARRRGKRVVG